MPLILTLHKANGRQETRSLDSGSLSIGRGASSDWVLQDPQQHLSKMHCSIAVSNGRYILTDLSANGVFVNGAHDRMPRDSQVVLTDGDEFRLGEFVMRVAEVDRVSAAALADQATIMPRSGMPRAGQHAPADDPFGLHAPAGGNRSDPLADPLADQLADPLSDPLGDAPFAAAAHGFAHPAPSHAPARLPDPFDTADAHGGSNEEDDLFKGRDADPSWSGAAQRDDVDAPMHAFVPPKPVAPPMNLADLDIDDLLGDVAPGPPAASPAAHPPVQPAMAQPAMAQPPLAPPEPAPAPPPSAPPPLPATPLSSAPSAASPTAPMAADAQRLVTAFLEGAGVPRLDVGQDPEAYLREVGRLFAAMVERLRDVLMSRAEVKRGFGVEQTMLKARDNNALKFSVTPLDAIGALLQPDRPGYMAPARALEEAFDDLRSHQLAVMAGVQTALLGLLRRFDPAALEARLSGGSLLDSIVPGARKARFWELFCATYKDIAREAGDDFQAVFGREFAQAYRDQVAKL